MKTLSDTHLVESRYIKREIASLPVDVRCSKTSFSGVRTKVPPRSFHLEKGRGGKGKDPGRGWYGQRKVGRRKRLHLSHLLSIVPCASSLVTRVSRSPLCESGIVLEGAEEVGLG